MIKALLIFFVSLLFMMIMFSAIGLHIEIFIKNGYAFHAGQLDFPAILLPMEFMKKGGISIALVIAAGLSVALHKLGFEKIIVQHLGWVSEEQNAKIFNTTKK